MIIYMIVMSAKIECKTQRIKNNGFSKNLFARFYVRHYFFSPKILLDQSSEFDYRSKIPIRNQINIKLKNKTIVKPNDFDNEKNRVIWFC